MAFPASPYVEESDGALRIAGTRVGLDSVVTHFQEGRSPEELVHSFPTVTLAQVYGTIAYYLENQKLTDDHFAEIDRNFRRAVRPLSDTSPGLFACLEEARRHMRSKRT